MLKQRVLTAALLIPLFIALLLWWPAFFCLAIGGIVVWGAWEWSFLMGIKQFPQCALYPLAIFLIMVALLFIPIPVTYFLSIAVAWWVLAAIFVMSYPKFSDQWARGIWPRALMGVCVLIFCWLAINIIFMHDAEKGAYTVLFLFALIWGADIAAYFVGRAYGKHKLSPIVSPGKTWEGLVGALCSTGIITGLVAWLCHIPHRLWPAIFVLAFVTVIFSIIGDLFESMMKRKAGVKDSGCLLPGHGGVLDRIDSLTAAAPVFTFGAILIEKFFQ